MNRLQFLASTVLGFFNPPKKQEPEIKYMKRVNDTLIELLDSHTNEYVTFSKVTKFADGSNMNDAKCDGVIYRKLGNEYFKRNWTGPKYSEWKGIRNANVPIYENERDFAEISDVELLSNLSSWTLNGFLFSGGVISKNGSIVSTAKTPLFLEKDCQYVIRIHITTTQDGYVDFRWNNAPVFDETIALGRGDMFFDVREEIILETAINVPQLSKNDFFEIKTDSNWKGSFSLVSIKKIEAPTQFFISNKASDDVEERVLNGIKFGRFNAGNIGIGDMQTLAAIEGGEYGAWNVAIGARSQASNIKGYESTSVGSFALKHNQAKRITAVGYAAGKSNIIGEFLTAIGYKAFTSNSIGKRNTGLGYHAALQNATGDDNTAIGYQALYSQIKNSGNTAVGSQAAMNCRGNFNTFLGALSGYLNDNVGITFEFSFCTSIGSQSAVYGNSGVALGFNAKIGDEENNVDDSIAIGRDAICKSALSVVIGRGAVIDLVTALRSTVIGYEAKSNSEQGISLGFRSFSDGIYTISIGSQSGKNQKGSYNTFVGAFSGSENDERTFQNVTCIGFDSKPTKNNQVVLGNSDIVEIVPGGDTQNLGSEEKRFNKGHLKNLNLSNLSVFSDNTTAKTGGLQDGDLYRKSTGELMVVF